MTIDVLQNALLWCLILNVVALLWWFLMLTVAHDWCYRMHGRWFKMSVETFDAIHYAGIAFYKICIFALNVVPYLALLIVGWK